VRETMLSTNERVPMSSRPSSFSRWPFPIADLFCDLATFCKAFEERKSPSSPSPQVICQHLSSHHVLTYFQLLTHVSSERRKPLVSTTKAFQVFDYTPEFSWLQVLTKYSHADLSRYWTGTKSKINSPLRDYGRYGGLLELRIILVCLRASNWSSRPVPLPLFVDLLHSC